MEPRKTRKTRNEEGPETGDRRPETTNRMVKPAMVTVRAVGPMNEGGHREAGEEFETTAERATALGRLVERIG